MKLIDGYELVVGLEVHAELDTQSKIFCSCSTSHDIPPNSACCPVCLGLPGALPTLNERAVELAVRAGLATGCHIAPVVKMDRKNYFYPDLPKAYQISQFDIPLCRGGSVEIQTESGSKIIGITRIHIEEDAGKLSHEGGNTLIDYNRCGVPLIEIVTEPDFRSPREVRAFLRELRSILTYAGVSKCRMNMGELRCDINLSVRKPGEPLGIRTEMKNLNSFAFAEKAVEYEYARQVKALKRGELIVQETRRFDQDRGITLSMRRKEDQADYRFFPEPDLPIRELPPSLVESIKADLPKLPGERRSYYTDGLKLSRETAETLLESRENADFFESAVTFSSYPLTLSNLLTGDVFAMAKEGEILISPQQLGELSNLLGAGEISSAACKKVLKAVWNTELSPTEYVDKNDLRIIRDKELILGLCKSAVENDPKSANAYRMGKTNALKALVGAVMAKSKGRADPVTVNELLTALLNENDRS